jgi:hypothetical protein
MAEKEERYISITQMVAKENIETEKYRVMPRQEAIGKMAKAFCETGAPNTWGLVEEHYKKFCLAGAEAALDALLEKE